MSSMFYIVISSRTPYDVKIGYWSGTIENLYRRYLTYSGNIFKIIYFKGQRAKEFEKYSLEYYGLDEQDGRDIIGIESVNEIVDDAGSMDYNFNKMQIYKSPKLIMREKHRNLLMEIKNIYNLPNNKNSHIFLIDMRNCHQLYNVSKKLFSQHKYILTSYDEYSDPDRYSVNLKIFPEILKATMRIIDIIIQNYDHISGVYLHVPRPLEDLIDYDRDCGLKFILGKRLQRKLIELKNYSTSVTFLERNWKF